MEVPSTRPYFSEQDIQAITAEISDILRSGRLILGPYTEKLERQFSEYCGIRHAVAVNSCTAALQTALQFFDVQGREVIVPTNTFVATANAVIYSGGTPVLADIKATTLCLDPAEVRKRITSRTKGVIVVHLAGFPCPDTEEIQAICREHDLFLMEDVAHAHGAMINGQKTGSLSQAGCFSFYPTKVMTTCTGGMLTTNDDKLAEYARSVRHHGVGAGLHDIVNLGNDWLMDEIRAALGIHQLRSLEENIVRRNDIARRYSEALASIPGMMTFKVPAGIRHVYYKYPIYLSPAVDKDRLTEIMKRDCLISLGSVYDPPCHLQPVYQQLFGFRQGDFPVADAVLKNVRCLPIFPQMTNDEFAHIINSIKIVLPQCVRDTTMV